MEPHHPLWPHLKKYASADAVLSNSEHSKCMSLFHKLHLLTESFHTQKRSMKPLIKFTYTKQLCLILDIHSGYKCSTNFICSQNPFTLKNIL